jgi:hypothetical protein
MISLFGRQKKGEHPYSMDIFKRWYPPNTGLYLLASTKKMCHYFMVQWTTIRVSRPVTKHLMFQKSTISRECSFEFHAQREIVALLFAHPQKVESLKKMKKWSQMWPSKVGGVKWWKRKTTAHFKDYYRTPKKFFESRFIGSKKFCRS